MQPLREKRQYGNDRTTLDNYVEEVALPGQPIFSDQQMGGRRDGQELGEPFNDSENDYSNPIAHNKNTGVNFAIGKAQNAQSLSGAMMLTRERYISQFSEEHPRELDCKFHLFASTTYSYAS